MEWISVKDRLPDNAGDVLCLFIGWDDMIFHGVAFHEEDGWYDSDGESVNNVIYWMPLPEPPKELNK